MKKGPVEEIDEKLLPAVVEQAKYTLRSVDGTVCEDSQIMHELPRVLKDSPKRPA